eukprot:TRINITY_DN57038_c0_g1_i1.p1 TRINITY_DN57038_c0_g1~~TRINITY_DN57038_c0_g1_i1.p1  ORF type:complete len:377 (-),score=61.56 TRINITY_DN57038_c0_g1_i1:195-1325(-)
MIPFQRTGALGSHPCVGVGMLRNTRVLLKKDDRTRHLQFLKGCRIGRDAAVAVKQFVPPVATDGGVASVVKAMEQTVELQKQFQDKLAEAQKARAERARLSQLLTEDARRRAEGLEPLFSADALSADAAASILFGSRANRSAALRSSGEADGAVGGTDGEEDVTLEELARRRLEELTASPDTLASDDSMSLKDRPSWRPRTLGAGWQGHSDWLLSRELMSGIGWAPQMPKSLYEWRYWKSNSSANYLPHGFVSRPMFFRRNYMPHFYDVSSRYSVEAVADPSSIGRLVARYLHPATQSAEFRGAKQPPRVVLLWKNRKRYPYVYRAMGRDHPHSRVWPKASRSQRKWAFVLYLDAIGKLVHSRAPHWYKSPFVRGR